MGVEQTAAGGVEVLVGLRGDRREPVGVAPGTSFGQQPVEQIRRRGVPQDVGAVLAADEIDVVDPEVRRDLLVAGRAVRTLPFE